MSKTGSVFQSPGVLGVPKRLLERGRAMAKSEMSIENNNFKERDERRNEMSVYRSIMFLVVDARLNMLQRMLPIRVTDL